MNDIGELLEFVREVSREQVARSFIKFIGQQACTSMTKRTNGDKASRLLNILDKHLNEKNCQYNPEDLFDQYILSIN